MIVDAGDVPVEDGGRIRADVVFRLSGGLAAPEGLGELEAAGLRCVIDLRGTDEDRSVVRDWAASAEVEYVSEPIPAADRHDFVSMARSESAAEAGDFMRDVYRDIVDQHGPQLAGTIAKLGERQPAGFGCAAGKDRTGIVAALLHVLLGASRDEAVRRYVEGAPTVDRLHPLARGYLELGEDDPLPVGMGTLLAAVPETINAALDHVDDAYGGVRPYLRTHGLDAEQEARLRERLVQPG